MSKSTPKGSDIADVPPDPPAPIKHCVNCKKPLSENGCGIDGQQRSYCVAEGEIDSPAQKARIEEQAAKQRG